MTMITVVNKSTLVVDDDVKLMVRAVAHQVRYHAAPSWDIHSLPVVFSTDASTAPPGSWAFAILDDSDQAGALAWHTEGPGGVVYGRVFARDLMTYVDRNPLMSVGSGLSHEVLETLCNPSVNRWCDDGQSTLYAGEVADPVESDVYEIVVDGKPVGVSNFVTPAWFDAQAAAGSRFDWMRKVSAPFTMTPQGYVVMMVAGQVSQQFGEQYPEWRKASKQTPLSRTARLIAARP